MNQEDFLKSLYACFECPKLQDCKSFQKMYIKALELLLERLDCLSKKLDSNG